MPLAALPRCCLLALLVITAVTLASGCERKQRARERDAELAAVQARERAKEAARRAALPLPEEPPVELLSVPSSGFSCQLDDVFAAKCRRCHTIPARHGAPLVFLTWDDTQQDRGGQKLSQVIGRAVRSGFMPHRIEANPPVQPLSDDEKKIILDWVDAGGPKQECDREGPSDHEPALPTPQKTSARAKPRPSASATPTTKPPH